MVDKSYTIIQGAYTEDRRAEYEALRREIIHADNVCRFIMVALFAALGFVYETRNEWLLSFVSYIAFCYLTEKRFTIARIGKYISYNICHEKNGFRYEKTLDEARLKQQGNEGAIRNFTLAIFSPLVMAIEKSVNQKIKKREKQSCPEKEDKAQKKITNDIDDIDIDPDPYAEPYIVESFICLLFAILPIFTFLLFILKSLTNPISLFLVFSLVVLSFSFIYYFENKQKLRQSFKIIRGVLIISITIITISIIIYSLYLYNVGLIEIIKKNIIMLINNIEKLVREINQKNIIMLINNIEKVVDDISLGLRISFWLYFFYKLWKLFFENTSNYIVRYLRPVSKSHIEPPLSHWGVKY